QLPLRGTKGAQRRDPGRGSTPAQRIQHRPGPYATDAHHSDCRASGARSDRKYHIHQPSLRVTSAHRWAAVDAPQPGTTLRAPPSTAPPRGPLSGKPEPNARDQAMTAAENLLRNETSPYLLQHANNPVHWRPWGPGALAEARASNRPILLSVGYAA